MSTFKPGIVLELLSWIDSLPGEVVLHEVLPAREGCTAEWPELSPTLIKALKEMGVERPYCSQSEAIAHALAGRSVLIQSSLPHRKSMGYDMVVVDSFIKNEGSKALYISPLPSTTQNRLENLNELARRTETEMGIYSLDLNSRSHERAKAREQGGVVLSNLDTLHSFMLPKHALWESFFSDLKFVVIDELHLYRGVLGSHAANILRRLRRICAHYGSTPIFLCKVPPLANSVDFATTLIGQEISLVVDESIPLTEHHNIVYNAALLDPRLNIRRAPILETALIAGEALANDIGTVVFAHSANNVQDLSASLSLNLHNRGHKTDQIIGYSGDYDPQQQENIQSGVDSEDIRGIVSTGSLELNIDLRNLELSIVHGLPDSTATAQQQMQVVRSAQEMSVGVLVASASPLDQFLTSYPSFFMGDSKEQAVLNPDNPHVLTNHMLFAASELPFQNGELFGEHDVSPYLPPRNIVTPQSISLQSATGDYFVVLDISDSEKPQIINHIDRLSAPSFLYPQGTYLQDGQMYEVLELDYEQMRCLVKRVAGDYYTRSYRIVHLTEKTHRGGGEFSVWGDVEFTLCLRSYKKLKMLTGENQGYGYIVLPEEQMESTACKIELPAHSEWYQWEEDRQNGSMTGIAHLISGVLPLFLMSKRHDLLVLGRVRKTEHPCIFIVDNTPGGSGYAQAASKIDRQILVAASKGLAACRCESGCLACVGHERPSLNIKDAVARLLSEFLAQDS